MECFGHGVLWSWSALVKECFGQVSYARLPMPIRCSCLVIHGLLSSSCLFTITILLLLVPDPLKSLVHYLEFGIMRRGNYNRSDNGQAYAGIATYSLKTLMLFLLWFVLPHGKYDKKCVCKAEASVVFHLLYIACLTYPDRLDALVRTSSRPPARRIERGQIGRPLPHSDSQTPLQSPEHERNVHLDHLTSLQRAGLESQVKRNDSIA